MAVDITAATGTNFASQGRATPTQGYVAEAQRQDPTAVGAQQAIDKVNASNEAAEQQQAEEKPDKEQLMEMAAELEKFMNANQRSLSFHVDDVTGRDVVTIKDMVTDETIRQLPSEEVLDLAARLSDLSGLLINTEA